METNKEEILDKQLNESKTATGTIAACVAVVVIAFIIVAVFFIVR